MPTHLRRRPTQESSVRPLTRKIQMKGLGRHDDRVPISNPANKFRIEYCRPPRSGASTIRVSRAAAAASARGAAPDGPMTDIVQDLSRIGIAKAGSAWRSLPGGIRSCRASVIVSIGSLDAKYLAKPSALRTDFRSKGKRRSLLIRLRLIFNNVRKTWIRNAYRRREAVALTCWK